MEGYVFWGFITIIFLGGMITHKLRSESRQKTIRTILENNDKLDEASLDKILAQLNYDEPGQRPLYQNMKLGAPIVFFSGMGAALMAFLAKSIFGGAWVMILAGGCFMMLNAIGMYIGGIILEKMEQEK